TRPRSSVVSRARSCEAAPSWKEAQAEVNRMNRDHWIDPLDSQAWLRGQTCESQCYSCRKSLSGMSTVAAAVGMSRQVFGHLSRVSLLVMLTLACEEGVPFIPVPLTPEFQLPPELANISTRLIDYSRGGPHFLDCHDEPVLRLRYIHQSLHGKAGVGL
ncbi:DUF2235 domain-containing protein, partial [Pseudomonas syringae]